MYGKWIISNSGERYLDSLELVVKYTFSGDPSKGTKRESTAYFILGGIRDGVPLPGIERTLRIIGLKNAYRVLQRRLEDFARNGWVKETEEEFTQEELDELDKEQTDLLLELDKRDSEASPEIPKAFEDFKDYF